MPYRGSTYSFVVDNSFQPFSMQEMLVPFTAYKEAYEQAEDSYLDLTDKADKFKYLSKTLLEGSKAAQIYKGYADDLEKQAKDLAHHGLTMGNRRGLTNLRRRYQGEIGRLVSADEALRKELDLRRTLSAKDPSMLYADENLNIDRFLDNETPNLYSISGNDLYTRGAAAGKAASSRIYSAGDAGSTLNGYYRKWVEQNGYSPESINAFRQNAAVIPELQQAADAILAETGVAGNLTGNNLMRARQSVLNGIIDGAVYQESVKPVRDEGKMSASAAAQYALQREQMVKNAAMNGLTWDDQTKSWKYSIDKDPSAQKAIKLQELKGEQRAQNGGGSSGGKSSTNRYTQLPKGVRIEWDDDPEAEGATYTSTELDSSPSAESKHAGMAVTYDQLPQYAKDRVDAILGPEGNVDLHMYYFSPYVSGTFNDDEAVLEILPYKISIFNGEGASDMLSDTDLEGGY